MIITTLRSDAGFGSNLLQVMDWLWYSKNTGIPVYANWDYNGTNFFDDLFVQKPKENIPPTLTTSTYYAWSELSNPAIDEMRYKDVPLYKKLDRCLPGHSEFYTDDGFKDAITFVHKTFMERINVQPSILSSLPKFENTLAIHIRMIGLFFTDSKWKVPLHKVMTESDFYAQNLKQMKAKFESGRYDNIYLGCDDQPFLDMCIKEFKDKAIYQTYERNLYHNSINRYALHSLNQGLHQRPPVPEEFYYALIDALIMSSCKDFVGCVSSMTFSSLMFNPYVNFELFDTMKHVVKTG